MDERETINPGTGPENSRKNAMQKSAAIDRPRRAVEIFPGMLLVIFGFFRC